jgi:hypothetical protein
MVMLCHQTHGVLHGHAVTCKGHHARAKLNVQSVEGCVEQNGISRQLKSPRAM